MSDTPRPGDYRARLPIGERLPLGDVAGSDLFPLEGEILVKPLEAPLEPEPPRHGEPGGGPCWACDHPERGAIWRNDRWVVRANPGERHGLPAVTVLQPHAHHDLEDLPPELATDLGTMIQRVVRAMAELPDVGRVHVNRWGDGGSHFHVWFLARPKGMWQMRGAMLAVWDDLLPPVPPAEARANLGAIAASLAAVDGEALPLPFD
jgi:diadenosine tetraphosphate (Ap4A) HIT family hydrolase